MAEEAERGFGMRKEYKGIGIGMVILLMMVGCMKTPDVEYVTNKEGQETLIEDNAQTVPGVSIAEQVQAPEHVTQEGKTDNAYTIIKLDADVVVPDGNAVPIYKIEPRQWEEADMKAYATALFDEEPVRYFLDAQNALTPELCYAQLDYLQNLKNQIESGEIQITEEGSEEQWNEDGTICLSVPKDYADSLDVTIQEWEKRLLEAEELAEQNPEDTADTYLLRPDEQAIYINDKEYNFKYSYCSLKGLYHDKTYYYKATQDSVNQILTFYMDEWEETSSGYYYGCLELSAVYRDGVTERNKCKYSYEEATQMCKDMLQDLGIEDMEVDYAEDIELRGYDKGTNEMLGKKGYIIRFVRGYQGIRDVYASNGNFVYDYGGGIPDVYWGREDRIGTRMLEQAVFYVLDDGIVRFDIINPMQKGEQLAESVMLLDFEQVLQQAVTQLEVLHSEEGTVGNREKIVVRQIEFRYARMQSPYKEDEYIMVPVWDFRSGKTGTIYVTINAIDGSVFNRSAEY